MVLIMAAAVLWYGAPAYGMADGLQHDSSCQRMCEHMSKDTMIKAALLATLVRGRTGCRPVIA